MNRLGGKHVLRRNRLLAVVAAGALALTACGTRLPHSRIVNANVGQPVDVGGSTGAAGAVVPGATSASSSAASNGVPAPGATVPGGVSGGGAVGGGSNGGSNNGSSGGGKAAAHGNRGRGGGASASGNAIITAACSGKGSGTIKLGNVGPYGASGAGATASPGRDILSVWAAWVNAQGGICGRKVEMLTRDDQGNASQTSSIVKDLVENQHVVAFVGNLTALTLSAQQSYLESKHVPVIGGDLTNGVWFKSADYFPQGSSNNEMLYRGFKAPQSRPNGKKIAFLYCIEVVTCSESYQNVVKNKLAQRAGSQIVYSKEVSITQISFAAECQAAKKAGAGVILPGGDSSFVERVANSCGQQGLKFAYMADGLSVSNDQANNKYLNNNLYVPTQVQPWPATNTPGAKAYHQAIRQFGPGVVESGVSMSNWVAALLAQQVLTSIGGGQVTPATVLGALHKVKNFTAGGLTAPLTFHAGAQSTTRCTGLAVLRNGKFVAEDGGKLSCRGGAPLPLPS